MIGFCTTGVTIDLQPRHSPGGKVFMIGYKDGKPCEFTRMPDIVALQEAASWGLRRRTNNALYDPRNVPSADGKTQFFAPPVRHGLTDWLEPTPMVVPPEFRGTLE